MIEIVFLSTCRVEMQIYAFHKLCSCLSEKNICSCYIFHNVYKLVANFVYLKVGGCFFLLRNAFTIKVIWFIAAIKIILSAALIVNKSTATSCAVNHYVMDLSKYLPPFWNHDYHKLIDFNKMYCTLISFIETAYIKMDVIATWYVH